MTSWRLACCSLDRFHAAAQRGPTQRRTEVRLLEDAIDEVNQEVTASSPAPTQAQNTIENQQLRASTAQHQPIDGMAYKSFYPGWQTVLRRSM